LQAPRQYEEIVSQLKRQKKSRQATGRDQELH